MERNGCWKQPWLLRWKPAFSVTKRNGTQQDMQITAIIIFLISLAALPTPTQAAVACPGGVQFAVIGDYGDASQAEADVAALIDSWNVDFILTLGDNNYNDGEATTIDANIGQFYHAYITPYTGSYGAGAATNRFFPALGNHDWNTGSIQPYLDYFTLPGNERYYTVTQGPVQIFVIDSDWHEPDGRTATSTQAQWLQTQLAASTAAWKLVAMHHPPYSSSSVHGSDETMQWPYAEWGATAVLAGHDHTYERLWAEGIPYFVNGLGGRSIYGMGTPVPQSVFRYNDDYGAMRVFASDFCINYAFYNRAGELIDNYSQINPAYLTERTYLPFVIQ